jgi:hypothetical protein
MVRIVNAPEGMTAVEFDFSFRYCRFEEMTIGEGLSRLKMRFARRQAASEE